MAQVIIQVLGDDTPIPDDLRRLACAAIAFEAYPNGPSNVTLDVAEEIRRYSQENRRPSQS